MEKIKTNKRVALVTGSASGIGANVAVDLASIGYFIIVTGRDQKRLDSVVAKCNEIAPQDSHAAVSFKADLTDLQQVDQLIQFIRLKFERIDVLVNNACWRGDQFKNLVVAGSGDSVGCGDIDNDKQKDLSLEAFRDFQRVIHVNLSVPMYLIHQLSQLRQDTSHMGELLTVVNVSSIASQMVVPLHTYSVSKACLSEMSRQVAKLSHSMHINSITISPGPVLTNERPHHQTMSNMTLMDRVGTTQEISDLVLFVIRNTHLFNGQELNIDGGYLAKQRQAVAKV